MATPDPPSPSSRLAPEKCTFFLCDLQEKFKGIIQCFDSTVMIAERMVKAAEFLDIPVVLTEQYPKGLGKTVSQIITESQAIKEKWEKTAFSMVKVDEVAAYLDREKTNRPAVVLFGLEAHICVLQTALDLRQLGVHVYVLADGCSSRQKSDRMIAFERMRQSGVYVTTSEAVLFELIGDAKHAKFRDMQVLIKTLPPDSGLA